MRRRTFIGAMGRPVRKPLWGRTVASDLAYTSDRIDLLIAWTRFSLSWDEASALVKKPRPYIIAKLTEAVRSGVGDKGLRDRLRACLIVERMARFKDHLTAKQLAADLAGDPLVLKHERAA